MEDDKECVDYLNNSAHQPITLNLNIMKGKEIAALVYMALAILYDISPVDIVPDIPVVGWIDGFIITATAGLNCIQQFSQETNQTLATIAKTLKWIMIILGAILITLLALFAAVIIKLLS